ncbi:unnamed protein product [Orchesella dallaii]|uniref:Uncharacterized protein n=1 Tax=Orchesella dallaii TaxID=48710 RepID=A0ABP1RPA8_9HEXA
METCPEDYSLACGPVRVPLLFKTNSDLSLVFHGEHQRYKESCTEPEFRDRFNHSDSLNNYSIPCSSLNSSVNLKLVDCAGNPIEPQEASDIDDCSNWRINTPDTSSEMMLEVLLTLKAYNINRGSKEIVESKSMHKAFLCCFQYEGPVFRTDAQNKYCNAPTIDAMSTGSWCGGVVNNYGKRIPSVEYREKKFKKFFMDLELTVRYHEKNGKDNWLNSPEINRKLVKCMCPDKLLDFNKTKWELAIVEECNPLIATMEELIDADLIPVPFRLCDHKWPPTSLPHKLGTPAVYVFEYDDYEMPDSFRKLGDPQTTSPCLLDSSYEHVFKNDGNPPLFDNAQSPLPPGKTDDCMSLPIPTPETVGFSNSTPLVAPKLRLVVEPFLELFKPGAFRDSKSVHCCYHYSGFEGNQHEVCNMPEPDAIKRQCYLKGRSLERKKHEFELVRRAVVHQYGGVFLGDRVPPLDLRSEGPEETKWKGCICNDTPSHSSNEQCKQIYLVRKY